MVNYSSYVNEGSINIKINTDKASFFHGATYKVFACMIINFKMQTSEFGMKTIYNTEGHV